MFFPLELSREDMQHVLKLQGFEEIIVDENKEDSIVKTHLLIDQKFTWQSQLKQAVENINALNIVNYKAQKMILSLDVTSE